MAQVTLKIPKEPVYVRYDAEQYFARTEPSGSYFVKPFGGNERKIEGSNNLFNDILRFGDEVTQKEYEQGVNKSK